MAGCFVFTSRVLIVLLGFISLCSKSFTVRFIIFTTLEEAASTHWGFGTICHVGGARSDCVRISHDIYSNFSSVLLWARPNDSLPFRPRARSSTRTVFTAVLLLLSGDVQTNPGPPIDTTRTRDYIDRRVYIISDPHTQRSY